MVKIITRSQLLGETGESAVRTRFLNIGFQFDGRSRLEAGVDGIAEVMDRGKPMARMIAVQVKATDNGKYPSENDTGFNYTLRENDLDYWRGSNLPIIIVLYRKSDETYFWKEVEVGFEPSQRKLRFDKSKDVLDSDAVDRLAALTVTKRGFGYYVPPLGSGEEALVNILPVTFPSEIFVSSTPHNGRKAAAILLDGDEPPRFDWAIKGGSFWSFNDPRNSPCREIVDLDQVEGIDTAILAFHEDIDEQNNFAFLLRKSLQHQVQSDLNWSKDRRLFYFRAIKEKTTRIFHYQSAKHKTHADVVNVAKNKIDPDRVEFVRHHAFVPRFEVLADQWYLLITPTYFFTTDGFTPHSHPDALLAGKKRMDNSASLRGQVIMWHRFLSKVEEEANDLFPPEARRRPACLKFGEPPKITLPTRVPEDVWGIQKRKEEAESDQEEMVL